MFTRVCGVDTTGVLLGWNVNENVSFNLFNMFKVTDNVFSCQTNCCIKTCENQSPSKQTTVLQMCFGAYV
jgi:hypothetical protein